MKAFFKKLTARLLPKLIAFAGTEFNAVILPKLEQVAAAAVQAELARLEKQ